MPDNTIEGIKAQIDAEVGQVHTAQELEQLRLRYLGRKGLIAQLTAIIPTLSGDERASFGRKFNELKGYVTGLIAARESALGSSGRGAAGGFSVDMGLPGVAQELGRLHPVTQVIDEICAIFTRMGFLVLEGPEVESEAHNFTGLNIPLEHPSRDAFDTFYLKDAPKLLLRSHTSPMQVRVMQERNPPLAAVVPGRVYRPDAVDASHSFMFHQIEGFVVDTEITFADLKGTLEFFAKQVFGQDIKMRFRPHFFPFTEPSAEMDISCFLCKGIGCSVCGRKGWLEILGSGMIHPNVFGRVGYDPDRYTGFAFGLGIERIAMLKYGIDDIRLFFENDLRFLNQF